MKEKHGVLILWDWEKSWQLLYFDGDHFTMQRFTGRAAESDARKFAAENNIFIETDFE